MKILVLSKYGDNAPSTRMRFLQYFPYLEQHGVEITCKPLFDNQYLQKFFNGQPRSLKYIAGRYWLRLQELRLSRNYDVIWLEAELFPFIPAGFENIFYKLLRVPVVVNYDDANFHNYDNSFIRRIFLKNKIAAVMRHAHTVVVGNRYLERYAQKAKAKNIINIPTVVDTDIYQVLSKVEKEDAPICIGWSGSASTSKYLHILKPVLMKLAKQIPIEFYTMGAKPFLVPGVEINSIPWSVAAEVPFFQSLDIGVMPLYDNLGERGKCGLKLIQYMACGKAVVGTPLEINKEIIENGVNGFWASTEEEWLKALLTLCHDAKLREKMGQKGRQRVEAIYSLKVTAPQILKILQEAVKV